MTRPSFAIAPAPGQESVWDYPRPPRLKPVAKRVHVVLAGADLAGPFKGEPGTMGW